MFFVSATVKLRLSFSLSPTHGSPMRFSDPGRGNTTLSLPGEIPQESKVTVASEQARKERRKSPTKFFRAARIAAGRSRHAYNPETWFLGSCQFLASASRDICDACLARYRMPLLKERLAKEESGRSKRHREFNAGTVRTTSLWSSMGNFIYS